MKAGLDGTTNKMFLSVCLHNLKQRLEYFWIVSLHKTHSRNLILLEEVRCFIVTEKGSQIHSKKKDGHVKNKGKDKKNRCWGKRQQSLATE